MGHTSNDLLHLEHKASSSSSLGSLFLFCHIFFLFSPFYFLVVNGGIYMEITFFYVSMPQNPHFLFARMGQSPSCRNLITLRENPSLPQCLQAKVTLFSLSLLLSLSLFYFLVLVNFFRIFLYLFFVLFSVCLAANCFHGFFFLLHIMHFMVCKDSCSFSHASWTNTHWT